MGWQVSCFLVHFTPMSSTIHIFPGWSCIPNSWLLYMSKTLLCCIWTRSWYFLHLCFPYVCLLLVPVRWREQRYMVWLFWFQTQEDSPTLDVWQPWQAGEGTGTKVPWLTGKYLVSSINRSASIKWEKINKMGIFDRLEMVQLPLISNEQCMEWYNRWVHCETFPNPVGPKELTCQVRFKTTDPSTHILVRGLGGGCQRRLWGRFWWTPCCLQTWWQGWVGGFVSLLALPQLTSSCNVSCPCKGVL